MNTEQLNQALRLTINELTTQLTNESTTKNLLAIQLTEAEQPAKDWLKKKTNFRHEWMSWKLCLKNKHNQPQKKENNHDIRNYQDD